MKMIRKILLMTLCLCLSAGAVYAAPGETDEYGNPIDWTEDAGGDDNAGNEGSIEAETSNPGYSFVEQADVLEQISSAASETEAPSEETGYLYISITEPSGVWSKGNIEVTLWSGNRKETLWLYRQNNWTASAKLPVGHYTYDTGKTSGTEFVSDIGTFDITADTPVAIVLSEGSVDPDVVVIVPTASDAEKNSDTEEKGLPTAIKAAAGISLIAVVMGSLYLIGKKKSAKDYRNDILD